MIIIENRLSCECFTVKLPSTLTANATQQGVFATFFLNLNKYLRLISQNNKTAFRAVL